MLIAYLGPRLLTAHLGLTLRLSLRTAPFDKLRTAPPKPSVSSPLSRERGDVTHSTLGTHPPKPSVSSPLCFAKRGDVGHSRLVPAPAHSILGTHPPKPSVSSPLSRERGDATHSTLKAYSQQTWDSPPKPSVSSPLSRERGDVTHSTLTADSQQTWDSPFDKLRTAPPAPLCFAKRGDVGHSRLVPVLAQCILASPP